MGIIKLMKQFRKEYKLKFKEYLERAKKDNDAFAQLMISMFYSNGKAVKRDMTKSIKYLKKSAKNGNMVAKARMYYYGIDVDENLKKCVEILYQYFFIGVNLKEIHNEKLVEYKTYERPLEEKILGYHMMGYIYEVRYDNIGLSTEKSLYYYQKAIEFGNDDSLNNLANIYHEGKGPFKKDYPKAFSLYRQAVCKSNIYSLYNLGNFYYSGQMGVDINIKKGLKYLEIAMSYGSELAMNSLGDIYSNKTSIKRDPQKSLELYLKAYKHGSEHAARNLSRLYFDMKDFDNSAFYACKAFQQKGESHLLEKFQVIVGTFEVNWIPLFHSHWPRGKILDPQILSILLISKFRSQSNSLIVKLIMIKGISMNIIKYLCNFGQIVINRN